MSANDSARPDTAALRSALLAYYDDCHRPMARTLRASLRLHRFKLTWLALPWMFASGVRAGYRFWRSVPPTSAQVVTRNYAALSGKDLDDAGQDIDRMVDQLGLVGFPPADWPLPVADPPQRLLVRPELEIIADALLTLALADWQTHDPLIAEAQTSYATLVHVRDELTKRATEHPGPRAAVRDLKANEQRSAEVHRRYREAWIRWLEQQPGPKGSKQPS
jgi:hypothetical protein